MREVCVAVLQMGCGDEPAQNLARAEALVRRAAAQGARVILLPELFQTCYFCAEQDARHFAQALPAAGHPVLARFSALAAELGVVLPVSFFERDGQVFFNSVAVIDADGALLGVYRKSHIPDGPGYQEKFYFSPGNTGFRVWRTRHAAIGVGICWDQWFPEAARAMALQGAELLLYPSAIGSEPADPGLDSQGHWQRAMQGHAAANMLPLLAANRTGEERWPGCRMAFYGSSFIADGTGALLAQAPREGEAVLCARFDLEAQARARAAWGLFRDRRPELYGGLLSLGAPGLPQ